MPFRRRRAKRQGEVVELAFLYKAAAMGFGVAKPYGDSESYDFMLDSGGHLWRVQVKSTTYYERGKYVLQTRHSEQGAKQVYRPGEIDFLVGYVVPEDAWYIIPVSALGQRKKIAVFPHQRNSRGRFEHFREAWCLMACGRESPCREELEVKPLCDSPSPPCPPDRPDGSDR